MAVKIKLLGAKVHNIKTVKCPKCGAVVSVEKILSQKIKEELDSEYNARRTRDEKELSRKVDAIKKKNAELELARKEIDSVISESVKKERKTLEVRLRREAENASRLEIEELKGQLETAGKKIEVAHKAELEIRKRARDLEMREHELEIEAERKLDALKTDLEKQISARVQVEHSLRLAEKDHQLDSMRLQIEDLKRRAEQGSQQVQGEVLELEMETVLRAKFPNDEIEPVAKGQRGGDIVHRIITSSGAIAGTILWESKRTRSFSETWIDKLKSDQRECQAEIAVIVSQALPKGFKYLTYMDGVWLADLSSYSALAMALRQQLLQIHVAKVTSVFANDKAERLFGYLTGTQFRQRVEAMTECYLLMKSDLDKERAGAHRRWAKQEKQLESVLSNTVSMYGDLQGILGSSSLPEMPLLSIPEAISADS